MRLTLLLFFSVAFALTACGRTPIDDFTDSGGPPRRDGDVPPRDAGPDSDVPPECRADSECSDGLACNGAEVCRSGSCMPGFPPPPCEDGIACTVDRCSEAAGGCESLPDSSLCAPGEICDPSVGCFRRSCMSDMECQDGFICNGLEFCADGLCSGGRPLLCDDFIPCTIDECSEAAGGCTARPDDTACSDGAFCNGAETCNIMVGCLPGMPPDCNDGDRCTSDSCDFAANRCQHVPVPDPTCVPGRCPEQDLGSRVGMAVATGTTVGAGDEFGGSCGGAGAPERTFRWTAPRTTSWTFDLFGSSYDTMLYVRRTCTGGELPGACNDDSGGSLQSSVTVSLVAGESVIVFVDGFGSNAGSYQLNIGEGGMMCDPFETFCADGRDNDCDRTFDCMDSDCFGRPECRPPCTMSEFACFDMLDEDCDGLFDCADPDCRFDPACCRPLPEDCDNRRDDDCDFAIDCRDRDCIFSPACRPDAGTDAGPRDGGGFDGGGFDGGMCTDREIGVAACTDGRDGDCDGARDCRDTDCSPFGPMGECCNGRDDDGDGQTDIFTCRCRTDADCVGVGTLEQVCWSELYAVCAPRCNFYGGTAFCRMFDPGLTCNSMTGQCVF